MFRGAAKDEPRQRAVTPEIYFPKEADQEHYLNVESTYKRWRSASPASASVSSDSLLMGEPLLASKEGTQTPSTGSRNSSSLNNTDEGVDEAFASKVRSSIENLEKGGARHKRHRHSNPQTRAVAAAKERYELALASEVTAGPLPSDEGSARPVPPAGPPEARAKVGGPPTLTAGGLLVLTLDNSKAASLSRSCKWGGHFRKVRIPFWGGLSDLRGPFKVGVTDLYIDFWGWVTLPF